ncbi:MAG: hypothetical protein HO274_09935 [Ferrovum myxofaciens]|uniref:hypothetical protein n=1 Tax=Ferrovum myxofaciens TaxID=416213 RepID=UPI00235317BC|nr:hypothetical protein [Ferrovum myxofaciens]QKE41598.1 MAG: hypothetical protein HO274_09935 [Ferrovum myxofaciens]
MHTHSSSFVATCPNCKEPFHFTQVNFTGMNDCGHWKVKCIQCEKPFLVPIQNPRESYTDKRWQILECLDEIPTGDSAELTTDIVLHNLQRDKTTWTYDYDAAPLYRCPLEGCNLDISAYSQLQSVADQVQEAWCGAENFLLSSHGAVDQILVSVDIVCSCGSPHTSTFYAPTYLGASDVPLSERCLLANVQGANLEDRLNCLASKSEVMDLLEKLVIRWQLTADRILLATVISNLKLGQKQQFEIGSQVG